MRHLQRLALIVCALACPALTWAQGGVPASPIYFSGPTGRPLAGATVTVCTSAGIGFPCSPLASIFTNAGLTLASPNPVTTDGNGNIPVIFASPGTYILSVTGSGITSTLITATVAGTGGGNVVTSANNNFIGVNQFKNIENTLFVDTATCLVNWGSADMGACITAAYAAGASTGVHIYVPTGVYNYTTPITFTTAAKPVFLECAPGPGTNLVGTASATQLNYTPTTGTALTINAGAGSKITGCSLSGAGLGNSTIGAVAGGANSFIYGTFEKVDIGGFGVGLQFGSNVYVDKFDSVTIHDNGQDILFPSGITGVGESISFIGGSISNKGAAFSQSCISVQVNNVELRFNETSIDQCGVVLNAVNVRLELDTPHFENPNGVTALPFVKLDTACSGCAVKTQGGRWLEDFVSARTEFILDAATGVNASNSITVLGGNYEPAETVAQLVHSTQPNCCAVVMVVGATQLGNNVFTNWVNPSTAGNLWFNAQVLAANYLQNLEQGTCAGIAGVDCLWADNADHNWSFNANANANVAPVQRLPQVAVLQNAYTNATTGFTNVGDGTRNFALFVAANRSYRMTCHLYYQAPATGGLNIQFTGPAAPTAVTYGLNVPLSVSTFNNAVATAFSASLGAVVTTAATNFDAEVSFGLINGANAGSVALQAKSSAAVALTIQAGSYCVMQ